MGVSDNLDSLCTSYDVIMELEMMRVATPHIGVEPCAGPKTDVMGFPRVVVECLLALAQRTRGRAAIETAYYRGITILDSTRQVYNLGIGGVPVHHDPVDGIWTNPGNREWEPNWDPPTPAGWRQVPDPTIRP